MRKPRHILLLLLLFMPVSSYAQTTTQFFVLHSGVLRASIAVTNPPDRRIIQSMREGLESEIQYNIRVYQPSGGLFSFLGDKLVGEWRRVERARWDEFSGDFLITGSAADSRRTRSLAGFLSEFFRLDNAPTGIHLSSARHYYVLSNVQIQIVRLVPPLTMIAPFLPHRQINTPWVKTEISVK